MLQQRIKSIDGLKGIACIIIFFSHIRLSFSHTSLLLDKLLSISKIFHIIVDGAWALVLFFVLSGFSIAMLTFADDTGERMKKLCTMRIFRLGVPVVVIFFITYMFQKMGFLFDDKAGDLLKNDWLKGLVAFEGTFGEMCKRCFWNVWIISDTSWMSVFNSLPSFLVAPFAIIPIAIMMKKNSGIRMFVMSLTLFVFLKQIRGTVYIYFFLGCVLAWIYLYSGWIEKIRMFDIKWRSIINVILVAGILTAPAYGDIYCGKFARHGFEGTVFAIIEYYYLASAVLLVVFVLLNQSVDKVLNGKAFQHLGKISYSVWMIHSTVIASYSCALYLFLRNMGVEHKWCTPPVFISSTILVIALATVFHNLVEKRLYNKLFSRF